MGRTDTTKNAKKREKVLDVMGISLEGATREMKRRLPLDSLS